MERFKDLAVDGTVSIEQAVNSSVIKEGTTITGDIITDGSLTVQGSIVGNVKCTGNLTVSGSVSGNCEVGEFFADAAKINGNITSTGAAKLGMDTIMIGDVIATSAVIAGAIKGDIDVQGPVIIDATAIVSGNIKAKSVQVNSGANINGGCTLCYSSEKAIDVFNKESAEE